jgi:hypothetical protein
MVLLNDGFDTKTQNIQLYDTMHIKSE